MKRIVALVLAGALMLPALSGCRQKEEEEPGNGIPAGSLILGEFLRLTAPNGEGENLINDSGMSGIEASNHLHGTDEDDMYLFSSGEPVVFELSRTEALGQLHIWNYNAEGKLDCGVKELKVEYSIDGTNYSELGTFTLAQSLEEENTTYGGNAVANQNDGNHSPINFAGVPGKYLRLTAVSNYGGAETGLAEIRLFRHKIRNGKGSLVTSDAFTPNVEGDTPEAAMNNQGMSDLETIDATHDANPANMWLSTGTREESLYVINLDGTYPVDKIALWNYNDPANLDSGIKDFEVWYTVEAPCDIKSNKGGGDAYVSQEFDFDKGSWIQLESNGTKSFVLPQATGSDAEKAGLVIDMGGVQAQHIKIVVKSNYGGAGFGLSQVRLVAGSGWAIEPSRNWTGLLSTSGSFAYTGAGTAYNGDGTGGRRQGGWVAADGMMSLHLSGAQKQGSLTDDSKTVFMFSDTAVGNMNNYKGWDSKYGYDASHNGWVNHSYLYLTGVDPDVRKAQFILSGAESDNHPYGNIMSKHYWLDDITHIGNEIYVAAIKYMGWDTPEGTEGTDLVKVPLGEDGWPDLNTVPEAVVEQVPDFSTGAVYENTEEAGAPNPDGYYYIYAKKNGRLVAARVLPENFANYAEYEYWNGEEWIKGDPTACNKIKASLSVYSSGNESHVCYIFSGSFGGKYANVYTDGSIGGQVKIGTSNSLTEKFGDVKSLYWAPEKYKYTLTRGYDAVDQWNYNAKAHPNLSRTGELLISYHIGTQGAQSNTMALEYVHPVFINMFEIAE